MRLSEISGSLPLFLCCWSCPARGCNGVSKGSARPDTAVAKGTPSAATRAAVELLGGMSRFVKKVVIKPNMSFAADVEIATNTHPVGALLRMCLEAGAARALVLDHAFRSGRDSLVTSGILSACDGVREGLCHTLTHDRPIAKSLWTGLGRLLAFSNRGLAQPRSGRPGLSLRPQIGSSREGETFCPGTVIWRPRGRSRGPRDPWAWASPVCQPARSGNKFQNEHVRKFQEIPKKFLFHVFNMLL